jgi:hypothetical protein
MRSLSLRVVGLRPVAHVSSSSTFGGLSSLADYVEYSGVGIPSPICTWRRQIQCAVRVVYARAHVEQYVLGRVCSTYVHARVCALFVKNTIIIYLYR